jgi:AcrR family transcriptional regulator
LTTANRNTREQEWAEAKARCRLSAEHIRMAKELGMSPRSLIKNIPNKTERWKATVREWIEQLYEKHQRKIASRGASRVDKPSPAPAESAARSSREPIPAEPDFLADDDSIPF